MDLMTANAATSHIDAPFDYPALRARPDWRKTVAWPYTHKEAFDLCLRVDHAQLRWLNNEEDEVRRNIVLLGGGRWLARVLAIAEMALAVEKEFDGGIRLVGDSPDLAYLRGDVAESDLPPTLGASRTRIAKPNRRALRRLIRIAGWTPAARLPFTLLAPQVTAISHNKLLRDCARHDGTRVGYVHCEALYRDIQDLAAREPEAQDGSNDLQEIIAEVTTAIVDSSGFRDPVAGRFGRLVEREAWHVLPRAQVELRAVRKFRSLPSNIWAGSGGYWPNRIVSIEALRRGGKIRRFAHGAGPGLFAVAESIAFAELAVSTTYTLPTPALAKNMRETGVAEHIANFRQPEIDGWRGDPNIRAVNSERQRKAGKRRRVLYGPSILLGSRQLLPPLLPDPVHLDWQFRFIEAMQRLPIDLLCRPHPEGLFRGQEHPLSTITPLCPQVYEELLPEADVLVFDFGQSTTFGEALCSDRPIVYIDFGNPLFTPMAREALARRCRIVRARFDDRNRPHVDSDELAEAICGGPDTAEPGEFRKLLLDPA